MACLICILGIPASGKTQFCLLLSSALKAEFNDSSILLVSYDSLIPATEEEKLIHTSDCDDVSTSKWKFRRQAILKAVGILLNDFYERNIPVIANDEIKVVEDMKANILAFNKLETFSKIKKNVFIIIDDNLYYRSMRYEYFQMARTYSCGFCQIYLNCDTKIALQRNKTRMHFVDEEIIKTMANKLEVPLKDKNKWEKYSLLISTMTELTDSQLLEATELIRDAIRDPVQQLDDTHEEMKQISRHISNTNVIHQLDTFLRRTTGQLIKELNSKKCDITKFQEINTARQSVLKDLKNGYLILPPEFINSIETGLDINKSENLKKLLLEKLKEKLSKC